MSTKNLQNKNKLRASFCKPFIEGAWLFGSLRKPSKTKDTACPVSWHLNSSHFDIRYSFLIMSIWLNEFPFFPENKTLQMVDAWGGWSLFQELLRTLKTVANKHGVSIPTVAVKYILDQVFTSFNHFLHIKKRVMSALLMHCG